MEKDRANDNRRRALVIAHSFSTDMNANRPQSAACVLSRLADVEVVTTDFDHWTKKTKERVQISQVSKIVYLKTLAYHNNVSIKRLLSHLFFSVSAGIYFLKHRHRFEIVYVTLPFNILAWFVLRIARGHYKIVDVTDIWPDVLPFSPRHTQRFRSLFWLWRQCFNAAAGCADIMMAVSDSFFSETAKFVKADCKCRRFYLGEVSLRRECPKNEILTIAYSGNLGRLYDFETLLDVIADSKRGLIQLYIIGDGDRREWLLGELKRRSLPHQYFGSIYDPAKLGTILSRAHLGFNGFVNTSAAFSTKASTYFSAGLPILNSMNGDLSDLVVRHGLGFNYRGGDRKELKACLARVDNETLRAMSENCIRFFASELDRTKVREEMYEFLRDCLEDKRRRVLAEAHATV
jgi:glycosyltransferase involved in cell wall biosynthesis